MNQSPYSSHQPIPIAPRLGGYVSVPSNKRSSPANGGDEADDSSGSDHEMLERMESEHGAEQVLLSLAEAGVPPKKKTKGRVKIKMEFIDNKLRRYTTFSKRKTGIMKKAYELSTLTGTQVMLLVASETGHVYTFATRKLQPMITSEAGKALIQTCLNSPDPPVENNSANQRMCATGFEETELTYPIIDEDGTKIEGKQPMFTVANIAGAGADANVASSSVSQGIAGTGHTYPMKHYMPTGQAPGQAGAMPIPIPHQTFTTILQPAGTAIQLAGLSALQQQQIQAQQNLPLGQQAIYRLPQSSTSTSSSAQYLTTISVPQVTTASQQSSQSGAVAVQVPQNGSVTSTTMASTVSTPVMYQTAQGLVYATPNQVNALPEGLILNHGLAHAVPVTNPQGVQLATMTTAVNQSSGQQMQVVPVSIPQTQASSPPTTTNGHSSAEKTPDKSSK
ncbi:serum response factor-like [Anneissia japonica]|uniref:serum response factor-like n=1 Tax=Anneissia japonica TaxID=1529436 RepID=UPI0014258C3A|nr:serum response factor-like [Anneissia japonica]